VRFLVIGLNYAPEPTGIGVYTPDLCRTLIDLGHSVSVVCAQPYYPYWRTFDGHRGLRWASTLEHGVEVIRCPIFVPARVTGGKRIAHYLSFLISAFVPVVRSALSKRPDIVVSVAPTLLAAPLGLLAAKLVGASSQIHVQDFEVEAGFATGQMAKAGFVGRLAMAFGDWVIRAYDFATSISPAMVARLVVKRASPDNCYELRNWANSNLVALQDSSYYRREWQIETQYVALYSGSIARKQGLETIVEAARLLHRRTDLTFVICGSGPDQSELRASGSALSNLRFYDLQPVELLGNLLNLATLHLLPQKADAADLVLPSKLTNILASGRPTVASAIAGTGLADEVDGCGLCVAPENPQAMADAIERLLDDEGLYRRFAAEAVIRAEQRWARLPIVERYLAWLSAKGLPTRI
jgi:colanic acid biosynthesis glycosyl transferase WcaI